MRLIKPILSVRVVTFLIRSRIRYYSTGNTLNHVTGAYLENIYDYNAKSYLRLLTKGVFDNDHDIKVLLCDFQRYLTAFNPEELIQLLELLVTRDIRENDQGIDIILILLAEMNRRLLAENDRLFSLKQIYRLSRLLKTTKFNRSTCLLSPEDRVNVRVLHDDVAFGFSINAKNTNTSSLESVNETQSSSIDTHSKNLESNISRTELKDHTLGSIRPDVPFNEAYDKHKIDIMRRGTSPRHDDGSVSNELGQYKSPKEDNYHSSSSSSVIYQPEALGSISDYRSCVVVPVCEINTGITNTYKACQNCVTRYGQLLDLHGYDQMALFIVLLGRSIIKQISHIKRRHENAVIPYLLLSSHYKTAINSHIIGSILSQQQVALARTKSLRNIGIVLDVIRKCKVRASRLRSALVSRLANQRHFNELCSREGNKTTLILSFSHIIMGTVKLNKAPKSTETMPVFYNILKYLLEHPELHDEDHIDPDVLQGSLNNVRLLVTYIGYDHLKQWFRSTEISAIESLLAKARLDYCKDFRTSDLHKQVADVLSTLGIECDQEVTIGSHICDLVLKKRRIVIEIDGPYHFNTTLNSSLNSILNRHVDDYRLTYTYNSRIKMYMLRQGGYKVIHIPYFMWPSGKQEQMVYAKRCISRLNPTCVS
eukprot:XP_001610322.1 hypothetical protein [Babesia bovis T2Bo]